MRGFTGLRVIIAFFLLLFSVAPLFAGGYLVYLKDKGRQNFEPKNFFHPNSLQKKAVVGLNPADVQEWPVNAGYLQSLSAYSDSVIGESRWLNAVLLYSSDSSGIAKLSFVKSIERISGKGLDAEPAEKNGISADIENLWLAKLQTGVMEDSVFHAKGINGKGIRIAVFDAGFRNANQFEGLSHLFRNGQVEQSIDFPARNKNVYNNHFHGTAVLTCMAGRWGDENTGLATGATFLLARTEYSGREPLREEFFWLMGAEWADQHGADIISSSLGYAQQRYFYRDMDGKKSIVSKAAGYAVRHGITVVNSAGNEGTNNWKYLITPADNDSVIAVGGLDPESGFVINFSSLGPGSAGQLKPNVIAAGKVFAGKGNGWGVIHGTSFSCPLVSGFIACMMSHDTLLKHRPMRLMQRLHESAHLFPYFDYAHGYGIPKASRFLQDPLPGQELHAAPEASNFRISIRNNESPTGSSMRRITTEVFLPNLKKSLPAGWFPLLYLSAYDERGRMLNYQVCRLAEDETGKETEMVFKVPDETNSIRFHYQGTTLNKSITAR